MKLKQSPDLLLFFIRRLSIVQNITLAGGKLSPMEVAYLLPGNETDPEGSCINWHKAKSKLEDYRFRVYIKAEVIAKTPAALLDQALQGRFRLYVAPTARAMGRVNN